MGEFHQAYVQWHVATLNLVLTSWGLWFRFIPGPTPRALRAITDVEARGLCHVITANFKA